MTLIEGVVVQPLRRIVDARGSVMHMLRADSPLFSRFGEVYFSSVLPGVVKAWKRHLLMTQHFAVPVGSIRLALYDDRGGSSTSGVLQVLEIGEENYSLVIIPPLVWYGFQGISAMPALVANLTDLPHDPGEAERLDQADARLPYQWPEP